MIALRSALFFLLMSITTIPVATVMLLTFYLPFPARYAIARAWVRLCLWLLDTICGLRYHLEGGENLPDRNVIVFSKHQSAWETMSLLVLLPNPIWILKRELLWTPFFGWALSLLRPIAIHRGSGRRAVQSILEQGMARLKEGLWIIVFPEGTRVAPGEHKRYGIGGALLAEKSGYPVLPVAHNAGEFWPRRSFLKYPGEITLVFGPLIQTQGLTAHAINQAAHNWIEQESQRISGRGPAGKSSQ